MVELSSMQITAKMNVDEVRQAFSIIAQSMKNAQKESKSTGGDIKRLEMGLGLLGKSAVAVGAAFTGMIYEASRKAPSLAGSMAVMKTSWDSMIMSLGEGLAPVFEKVSNWTSRMADWANSHPDLFATVIGGGATAGAIAGLVKLFGLEGALSSAASALSPFLVPVAAGTVLAGLTALMGWILGVGLENQFLSDNVNVPIPDAAKTQIEVARNTGSPEFYDLLNRYGSRTSGLGGGGESTPQIDFETGELYSIKHMERDIIRNAQQWMNNQNWTTSTRNMAMNSTDSYNSSGWTG